MSAKKKEKVVLTERHYNIIKAPVITEKATMISENNQIACFVCPTATKTEVKEAFEGLFDVTVLKVNTLVQKGKTKRFKGVMGRRSDLKKAIVTLKDGDQVDLTSKVL
jgi:large subunit ribosomal protein L23|tara:strand:- start:94 stop:417 length:324 start_codon:yes stop_codon:yes gene_type:complete